MNNGNLDHKTKMISLRLSEVEFEFLKTRYQSYGARNVSDLARLAVQRMMQGSEYPGNNIAANFVAVTETLAELESRVSTLENQLALRWARGSHIT
jgi:hypothetical protein